MLWLTLGVLGALWAACWAAAGLATVKNFDVAAVLLRAVDARTRRRRVRNIVLGAPLLASVFNLVVVALAAGPALAYGPPSVGSVLYSGDAVHPEYLLFCAAAACVSMACGAAYLEIAAASTRATTSASGASAPDFSRKHVQGALGASAAAWAICGSVAAAALLFAGGGRGSGRGSGGSGASV
jgi:hypothetical protein